MHTTGRGRAGVGGWTSEASSGFALAGFLSLVFVAVTLLAWGPLAGLDASLSLERPPQSWLPWLHTVDRVGQRAVCLPVLGIATYRVCRRRRSWRPGVLAAASVFTLNLVVLMLKAGLARGTPHAADPSFFGGGMAYPSGHSAHVVLVYGLVCYLLLTYDDPTRRTRRVLWSIVPLLSAVMVYTSLTLQWHWMSDLVSGLVVGGVVLQLTASIDRVVPDVAPARGWRNCARQVGDLVRPRRSRGRAGPA